MTRSSTRRGTGLASPIRSFSSFQNSSACTQSDSGQRPLGILEECGHLVGVDHGRATAGAVELAGQVGVGLAPGVELPAADLAARVQVALVRDGAVVLGDPVHVGLVVEGREVRQPGVVLVRDPDAVILPGHRERSPLGMHPLAVVGDVAAGDRGRRQRLVARRPLGVVDVEERAEDDLDRSGVGRPDREADAILRRPVSPMLLGAQAAVVRQVVALLLDGIAVAGPEREGARAVRRLGVAHLGGDAPLVLPRRAVDDDAPAERPPGLRLIKPDLGPVAGAAVLARRASASESSTSHWSTGLPGPSSR